MLCGSPCCGQVPRPAPSVQCLNTPFCIGAPFHDAFSACSAWRRGAGGKTGQLTVTGYTDSDGSDGYNQQLSEARAQTVADALKKQLPSTYTFKVVGKGEKLPVARNSTSSGRARNRRVAITLPS